MLLRDFSILPVPNVTIGEFSTYIYSYFGEIGMYDSFFKAKLSIYQRSFKIDDKKVNCNPVIKKI